MVFKKLSACFGKTNTAFSAAVVLNLALGAIFFAIRTNKTPNQTKSQLHQCQEMDITDDGPEFNKPIGSISGMPSWLKHRGDIYLFALIGLSIVHHAVLACCYSCDNNEENQCSCLCGLGSGPCFIFFLFDCLFGISVSFKFIRFGYIFRQG